MRYKRHDLQSTLKAAVAKSLKTQKTVYVFATAYGYTIWHEPPPGPQSYYAIYGDKISEMAYVVPEDWANQNMEWMKGIAD